MVALLALGKSLEERIIPFIGHDIISCPTIMRLVSSDVSCRDIIITKASFADQKKITNALGSPRSIIAFYDEKETMIPPLSSSGYTVFLPYSFTEEQLRLAIKKADHMKSIFGTAEEKIIGSSLIMRKTRLLIEKAMKTNLPVHLVGETGTGKTLAAETIHRYSNPKREMIREECGQLTTSLTDSILFGHTKGAYSGAVEERKGLIALADKSTLFLDEIQDLSLEVQAKLLGVLETGTFRRLGSDKPMHSSFRLITAGCVPLKELVRTKRMRNDFFHRINYIEIRMPSLSEHMEDIPELISKCEMDNGYLSEPIVDYTPFMHEFSGNVRELYRDVKLYHEGIQTLADIRDY